MVPDCLNVVLGSKPVYLFTYVFVPFCYQRPLDEGKGESNSLDIGVHSWYEASESNVAFKLLHEVVSLLSIACEDTGECSHHFNIMRWLGWLLSDILSWSQCSSPCSWSSSTASPTASSFTSSCMSS